MNTKKIAFFLMLLCSNFSSAGEIVWDAEEQYLHPSCAWIDGVNFTFTLICNNKKVVYINAHWDSVLVDTTNYEVASNARSEYIVSRKTPNNVYSNRPLDSNYGAYSIDGVLDKPVIFVEGYDPQNKYAPRDYYANGINKLVQNGRDIFIVNLNSSEKNIDDNALLLQQIILEINAAKGGNHPTAVIGYSMGGLVARKALKNMETSGISHQVSLYVSYDAPHLGANSPLSLQETVEKIVNEIDSKAFGYTPSSLKKAQNIYNSPAAKEMLIGATNYQPTTFESFPKRLARVAITSGSMHGTPQSPSTIFNEQVADFKFYLKKNDLISWSVDSKFIGKMRGGAFYDNTPGSYLYQFDEGLTALKSGADTLTIRQHSPNKKITFIPTTSALAINGLSPSLPASDAFKYFSPFDMYIAVDTTNSTGCTAFENQTSIGYNQDHSYFNPSQLDQLNCALEKFHKIGAAIPDRSFKSN